MSSYNSYSLTLVIKMACCRLLSIGLSCVVTSVLYPMTIESERLRDGGGSSHELGLGYFLVCSSAGGFCLAASCLCFDDMIRSIAKLFCRRPRTQRSYGRPRYEAQGTSLLWSSCYHGPLYDDGCTAYIRSQLFERHP